MAIYFQEQDILDAIRDSAGIISTIAKRLNVEWHSAKKYIELYDSAKELLNDEIERTKDIAESNIVNAIKSGDIQLSKWYMQTIGKDRGYSEKQEIDHNVNGKIDNKIEVILIKDENRNT